MSGLIISTGVTKGVAMVINVVQYTQLHSVGIRVQ